MTQLTNLAVNATYESRYDDQSDASLTESDLKVKLLQVAAQLRAVTIGDQNFDKYG